MLRTVLFAPEDLALVKGDPGERRRFLDELLTARAPRFAGVRSDYDRVLKQRNALLKSAAAQHRPPPGRPRPAHAGRVGRAPRPDRRGAARGTARPGCGAPPLVAKAYGELAATAGPVGLALPLPRPS